MIKFLHGIVLFCAFAASQVRADECVPVICDDPEVCGQFQPEITFSPGGGAYASNQAVRVSFNDPSATVRYTLDGREPTDADPVLDSRQPFLLDRSTTITVRACGGMLGYIARSATYIFYVQDIVTTPSGGTVTNGTLISLSVPTAGAQLEFSMKSCPLDENWQPYTGPFQITSDTTLYVKASKSGYQPSYRRFTYTTTQTGVTATASASALQPEGVTVIESAADPSDIPILVAGCGYTDEQGNRIPCFQFTPPSGIYNSNIQLTVSHAYGPDVLIHYTLDGRDPVACDPIAWGGVPIPVDGRATVKVAPWRAGEMIGNIESADYIFEALPVQFNPSGGTVPYGQKIVLSCGSPGAAILFGMTTGAVSSVDPCPPPPLICPAPLISFPTNWQRYTEPVTILSSLTLWAKAEKEGYKSSIDASSYNVQAPPGSTLVFGLEPIFTGANRLMLQWLSATGFSYRVQISSDLLVWETFRHAFDGTGGLLSISNVHDSASSPRFFRVVANRSQAKPKGESK